MPLLVWPPGRPSLFWKVRTGASHLLERYGSWTHLLVALVDGPLPVTYSELRLDRYLATERGLLTRRLPEATLDIRHLRYDSLRYYLSANIGILTLLNDLASAL
ncbi:MAG: hypothetical protein KTR25_19290 [Myxococcales bacterium]|nr:hypothetical protein [Myxococcales bacterium]